MEDFTIIDGIAAVVIILSAVLAYSRGLVRETLSIGGWIGAAVVGYLFADQIRPLLNQVPVLGEFIIDQCELGLFSGFAVVMVIGLLIFSIFTPLFSGIVQRSILGGLDQGLGFLFGIVRGVLLIVIALIAYNFIAVDQDFPMVDNSRTVEIFGQLQTRLEEEVPTDIPGWLQARINDFVGACDAPVE